MNVFKRIILLGRIEKAVKRAKQIMTDNSETAIKLNQAVLNLKGDLEILVALLPLLKGIYKDIKELIIS